MKLLITPKKRLIILSMLIAGCSPVVLAQGFSPETQETFQQIIERPVNNSAIVGGISVAVKVDGLAEWTGAAGYASRNVDANNNLLPAGTPFEPNTLSRIYSITKTFTAALTIELSNSGAFSLNDPVSKFMPLHLINDRLNAAVTIRQLLAHESGYSDWSNELNVQIAVAFQPTRVWTPFELLSFINQLHPAGEKRQYSGTNYIVLGAIIENVTGTPVEQHMRSRFFTPLNLPSMYFAGRESVGNRGVLASPHDNISAFNPVFQLTGQPTFPDAFTNISRFPYNAIESIAFTEGAIVSNVADVAKWGNALFGGNATSKGTIDLMINSLSPTPDEDGDRLGYGVFSNKGISETDFFIGHDGNAPGYRSLMFYQPDKKITLALLINSRSITRKAMYDIAKELYEALPAFTDGNPNREESKIIVCFNGHSQAVAPQAAAGFIQKGAYLGACDAASMNVKQSSVVNNNAIESKSNFSVYPNPFKSQLNFSFTGNEKGKVNVSLYDISGRLIQNLYNGAIDNGAVKQLYADTRKMKPGVYIVRVTTSTGTTQKKLVLER